MTHCVFLTCKQPSDSSTRSCENGLLRAQEDSSRGYYEIIPDYLYDYDEDFNFDFDAFYTDYIKKNYGVSLRLNNCQISEENECYDAEMERIVLNKFGANFLKTTKKEAQKLYPDYVQSCIDDNHIFGWSDIKARYVNGKNALHNYLSNKLSQYDIIDDIVEVRFVVDKVGQLNDIQIINGSDEMFDHEIIAIFQAMPSWQPAIINGQKVNTRVSLPLVWKRDISVSFE